MLVRFDIVLVAFPFTDRPDVKPRPAMVICLSERHQDLLLAFISSRVAGAGGERMGRLRFELRTNRLKAFC